MTDYSSHGFPTPSTTPGQEEDFKPDLMTYGGSSFHSAILAADIKSGNTTAFADRQADDYWSNQGISVAEVPEDGDFDLHFYSAEPGRFGRPVGVATGASPRLGVDEALEAVMPRPVLILVKQVAGRGTFALSGGAAQKPEVQIMANQGRLRLRFQTVGAWRYRVERADALGTTWTTVDDRVGTGGFVEVETDAGGGGGFFRVRVD